MPIYQVDVEKKLGEVYWTNVYHIEAADLAAATLAADGIVDAEVAVHDNAVTITKMRVSDLTPFGDTFNTVVINAAGTRGISGDTLPLFDVVRVDFTVFGRRPGRKYLRLPLSEGDQANGMLTSAMQSSVTTLYCNPLKAVTGLCAITGDTYDDIIVAPAVAMRQLRRGSKRKTTPVLP